MTRAGLFSLHLARCRPAGSGTVTVLGFEPAAETYGLAVRNLRENGVCVVDHGTSNLMAIDSWDVGEVNSKPPVVVHCIQAALADFDGEDELCFLPYLSSSTTLAKFRSDKAGSQVWLNTTCTFLWKVKEKLFLIIWA